MNSLRNWIFKPKRCDKSYLAQFYYANEELNEVASELDSFDGRKEPERCHHLVTKLRNCQDAVLTIVEKIMTEIIPNQRAPRDFRVKFPEEVSQENLAGQLWFGAECLAAGSSIQHREIESASMRPLARTVTNHIDRLRTLLRDQCLRDPNSYSNRIRRALIEFDQSFAEFELSYVSAMVTVKTMKEYDQLQEVTVLFCETVQRALRLEYLSLETIESFDPELMITIPRLAIVCGLLIYPDGPVNPDLDPTVMCHMFRPFQILLFKIRELLWTMNSKELRLLELALCSCEETPGLAAAQLSRLNSCEGSSSQAAAHLSRLNICEGSSSQAAAQLSRLNSYEGSSSQAAAKLSRLSSCEVSSSQATAQLPHLGRRDDAAQAAVRFSSEEPFIHAAATTQLSQPSNVEALNFSAVPQSCVDSLQSNSLVNFDDDRPCDAMEPENSKANESQGARRLDNSQGAGILSESSLGNNDDLVTENSTEHRDFRSCMSSIVRTDAEIEETSTTLTNYSIDTNNEGDLNTASSQNSSFSEAEPSNLTVDLVNESQGDHCTDEMLPSVSDDNGMSATGSCVVNNISCNNEHYESELIDRASDGCSQNCDTELNGEVSRNLGNNDNGLNINRNVNVLNDSNSQLIENASETLAEIVSNLSSSDVAEIIINSELSDEIPAENSLEIHRNVRHCDVNKYRCNGVRDCRSDVEVACLETSPELTTNIIRNKISLFVCNELERNRVMNELSTLDGYIVRTGNNASGSESQILLDFEDPSLVSSCDRNNTDCSDINSVPSNSLAINDFSNGSTTESNQVTSNEPLNADDGLTSESLQNADELIDQRSNFASAMPNCSEFDASASEKSIGVADYSDSVLNALATSEIRDSVTDNVTLDEGRAPMRLVTDFMSHRVRDEGGRVVHGGGADVVEVSTSVTSQYSTDTSNTVCAHSDGSCWSIETSTDESEDEDRRVHLAIQAAGAASRHEARSHFRNSSDLIHRLFVCISGVADQLQTNHASDLRHILQRVFEYSMTSEENSESTEETVSQVTAGLSPSSEEQGQDLADDTADTGNSEVQNVSDCDNGLLVRRDGGLMTLVQGQGHQVNERSGNAGQGQSPTRPGNIGQGQSPARSGNIGQSPVSSESLGQGQSPVRSGVVGQGQNPTRSENIDQGQSPIRSPGVSHVEGHLDHVPGRGVMVPEGGGRGDEEWSDSDCSLAEDALVALGGESASDLEYSTSVTSGASVSDGGELLIAPQWLSDDTIRSCMNCRGSFSFIRRRHHCRHCGKIFCAQCSSNQIALPKFGHNKPVRVCDQCFFFRLSPFTLHSSS